MRANKMEDLLKSGIGAIIGFVLAQVVNLVKIYLDYTRRPILTIVENENSVLLSHSEQDQSGVYVPHTYHGLGVRNDGRTPVKNLKCYILKIEIKKQNRDELALAFDSSTQIPSFEASYRTKSSAKDLILIPGAKHDFLFGIYRQEMESVLYPAIGYVPDYYENVCDSADYYVVTVVAMADNAEYVERKIIVK
jgi:hypothetical protein